MTDRVVRNRFEAVTGQYQAAMAEMMASTRGLAKQIDSVSASSKGSFKSLGMGLLDVSAGTAAVAAGAAVAGAVLVKFLKSGVDSYVELAAEVRDYQRVTNDSAEESSKMVAVANVLGLSTDTLAMGMFRLSRNVHDHADALHAAGVEVVKTKSGQVDLTATLGNVATAYQKVGAGVEGNAVAAAAFGARAAKSMLPVLKQGKEQLEEFYAVAAQNHEILHQSDLDATFQYQVATRELSEAWKGFEREAAPGATKALTWIFDALQGDILIVEEAGSAVGWLAGKVGDLIPIHLHGADAAHKHAEAEQADADQAKAATASIDAYSKSLKDLYAVTFGVQEKQDKFNKDLDDFADKVKAAQLGGDKFATSLDATSTTGLANREMLRGLVKSILDTADAASQQGQDVAAATAGERDDLNKVMQAFGMTQGQAEEYTNALTQLDGLTVKSTISLDTSTAMESLSQLSDELGLTIAQADALRGVQDHPDTSLPGADLFKKYHNTALDFAKPQRAGAGLAAALAGKGPVSSGVDKKDDAYLQAVWQARMEGVENRFHVGQATLAQYEASLDEQMAHEVPWTNAWVALQQKKADAVHFWSDATKTYLDALYGHQKELEDNQYTLGAKSKDEYLAILEERLKGLEKYSNAWTQIMQQIEQVEGAALDAQLKIIQAVDQQRLYDQAYYALAGQRQLSAGWQQGLTASLSPAQPSVVVQAGKTVTYNPTLNAYGADATTATTTANQQMRDYAALVGV